MCALAAERTSHWLMMDGWEAFKDYQRTAVVLDHFDYEINQLRGGVRAPDGSMRPCRIMLLAGSDLIATMSEPGVWSEDDVSALFPRPRRAIRRMP
jgi:nicotinamide mononucleotide adenylyltransferase